MTIKRLKLAEIGNALDPNLTLTVVSPHWILDEIDPSLAWSYRGVLWAHELEDAGLAEITCDRFFSLKLERGHASVYFGNDLVLTSHVSGDAR